MGRSVGCIVSSVVLVSLFAQLAYDLPIGETIIPISGQTFALFLAAWFLKPAETIVTVVLYLILGGAGLPIYADGASGWKHLQGFTSGYLWAFIPAAALVSYYSFRNIRPSFPKIFMAMFGATLLVLIAGAFILAWKANAPTYFQDGSLPFLPGGIIKSLVGAGIVYGIQQYRSKSKSMHLSK